MADLGEPGRRIEVIFTEEDERFVVDAPDGDRGEVADTLLAAIAASGADEAEGVLRAGIGTDGSVERSS
ncbi:MAG TPA: hypothetical protein VFX65_05835 [Candidatus Limnocylindrales bacterium]|nr:hypothetical protein [Candidatus Limnocylindrales bacterium]